ncbi:YlxR family protein [Desulfocurvus sp. DL9XJH121]
MHDANARHVPIRMCVICRKRLPKHEMTRYVCPVEAGGPMRDEKQILPGRGFYVCDDRACVERIATYKGRRRSTRGKE